MTRRNDNLDNGNTRVVVNVPDGTDTTAPRRGCMPTPDTGNPTVQRADVGGNARS